MNPTIISSIIQMAEGNPGAMNFLMQLMSPDKMGFAIRIFSKLQESEKIRGSAIYVLFSDLCGGDIRKVARLCDNCPTDILEDACSRQDYSGKPLVEKYF